MIVTLTKQLVRDTFENKFNKEKFTLFIKNLLNYIDDESDGSKFVYQGTYIPQVYQDSVYSLERLGKYTDPEGKAIDILIVTLKKEKSLDRARTMQRNFVAWYLDGSRGGKLKDAALVAFVSPDNDSWRFSLVKMDYKIQEAKVKKELTPAKRYSFLVGPDEKCHTAQSRLLPIIDDDKNNPSLKQIEEAFNIEKVTKEFFERYRELFLKLKESLDEIVKNDLKIKADFEKKNVDTASFAKKLLGQIVFLYFLQKKGWFGVERDADWGTGPKNFLRVLFNKEIIPYKNFFNDVLEPLFYEALAKKRDKNYYGHLNCKIPFLNGGLFDPINDYDWVFTDIHIDNEIFSNDIKTKEGDRGTGILDVFDRYNFTVREDEPLEKEVAVDPEMLGKVFENLLEIKDRKSKGTYYTPREIVHYMCQETLINFLFSELRQVDDGVSREDLEIFVRNGISLIHNDQAAAKGLKGYKENIPKSIKQKARLIDIKLSDIKVCDPAVGSGAFLVGMMNEIVNCREVVWFMLNDVRTRDSYRFKREAIQHSLYGVDIEPSAVEVAKLRLWLSLVVEEDDIKKIRPLPNLDYKLMQGNSLLEEFEGVKIFDEKLLLNNKPLEYDYLADLKRKEQELAVSLLSYYQKNPSWMKNKSISRPIELTQIEMEMDKVKTSIKKNSINLQTHLIRPLQVGLDFLGFKKEDVWLKIKKLYSCYFKEYDGDKKKRLRQEIEKVIWELIETTLKEEKEYKTLKDIETYKNNGIRPFFLWKLYFADVFREKGGFDIVIANPPYVGESGHKDIFRPIAKGGMNIFYQGKMDLFYFFFHLALNIGKPKCQCAFISTNYFVTATGAKKLRSDLKERSVIRRLINFNELKIFESALGQHNMITIFSKSRNKDYVSKNCLTRRSGIATPDILTNIFSGKDEKTQYYKVRQSKLYDGVENYIRIEGLGCKNNPKEPILEKINLKGVPLINICDINQGLVTGANKISNQHIKKHNLKANIGEGIFILNNKEVKNINFNKKEARFLRPWFKNSDIHRWVTNNSPVEKVIYLDRGKESIEPNIEKHLKKYFPILKHRREVENGVINWWQIQWPREEKVFSGEKIVVPYRSKTNTFGYNNSPWYAASDVYFITRKDKTISLKYLLALLNSKLYKFWLYNRGKRKGNTLELFYKPLSEVPILKASEKEQECIIKIVDKILNEFEKSTSNLDQEVRIKDYEEKIDEEIFKLYGLNNKEIKIIAKSIE